MTEEINLSWADNIATQPFTRVDILSPDGTLKPRLNWLGWSAGLGSRSKIFIGDVAVGEIEYADGVDALTVETYVAECVKKRIQQERAGYIAQLLYSRARHGTKKKIDSAQIQMEIDEAGWQEVLSVDEVMRHFAFMHSLEKEFGNISDAYEKGLNSRFGVKYGTQS